MSRGVSSLFVCLCILISVCNADVPTVVRTYEPLQIIARKQSNEVVNSDEIYVVLFTDTSSSSSCAKCKEFAKTRWSGLYNTRNTITNFAVADASVKGGKDFIAKYIKIDDELPVVKVFTTAGRGDTPWTLASNNMEGVLDLIIFEAAKNTNGRALKSGNPDDL
eukprot:PhF_6_TR11259/c0_g1_i1/m.18161